MKTIAGAILMFAAAVFALSFADTVAANERAIIFGIPGIICFLLGLYFLFFAKDKPNV